MKTVYACFILLLVFSGQALAQLNCRHCEVTRAGGTTEVSSGNDYLEILRIQGTFTGNIMLKGGGDGTSHFDIWGTGHYEIKGVISSDPAATRPIGLTLAANEAGGWGGYKAGIILSGDYANTYTGTTIIRSGYVACKKPEGIVAIPGDIRFGEVEEGNSDTEPGLWFNRSNQLSGRGKIYFDRGSTPGGRVNLNGTTQRITGLDRNPSNQFGGVVSINPHDLTNIPDFGAHHGWTGVLILDGGAQAYSYGGTNSIIESGYQTDVYWAETKLELQVKGTGQRFTNPEKISRVTFNTEPGGIVEFDVNSGTRSLGGNIFFKGSGTVKKTGVGSLGWNNSKLLQSGGRIWVNAGVLQNSSTTLYTNTTILIGDRNKAVLQVDEGAVFDLNGVYAHFGGLTGVGKVLNNAKSYSTLILETDNEQIFSGQIQDNAGNHPVSMTENGKGGIGLWKRNNGTQVLRGTNTYTGPTTLYAGTLKLQGGGKLGNGNLTTTLQIANSTNPAAVFEHNGTETQIFTGNITRLWLDPAITAPVSPNLGIFRQSGTGKTIINGNKDFTGRVDITGGFLGGSGNISKAHSMTVGAQGSVGGGLGTQGNGAILTVSGLAFSAVSSTLLVTTKSDNTPSLVEVKTSTGSPGVFSAPNGFTLDLVGDNMVTGYLIKCSNPGNLPMPTIGRHNTAKVYCFAWDTNGLLMTISSATDPEARLSFNQPLDITGYSGDTQSAIAFTSNAVWSAAPSGYKWKQKGPHNDVIAGLEDFTADWTKTAIPAFTIPVSTSAFLKRSIEVTAYRAGSGCMATKTFTYTVEPAAGLTCDNCSFTRSGSTEIVTGTTAIPAVILSGRLGEFSGNITLNGACTFTVRNLGNYTLSGQITGDGPLVYQANEPGNFGNLAGITLSGEQSNTYTGLTTITKGYVICHKTNDAVAIPGNVKISAVSGTLQAHLWCKANNQFGSTSVVDLSDGQALSFFHLKGTTQNIAGLKGNNEKGVLENWESDNRPAPLATESSTEEAILHIAIVADNNNCIFGGGGKIRRGTTTQALTVNIISGTQIIENPTTDIKEVTFTSTEEGTLEFNTTTGSTYRTGDGVVFEGYGNLKKTGPGILSLTNASVLKSGGQIWVYRGTLRNNNTTYSTATESNQAILRVEAGESAFPPVFDLWGSNSVFGGLTGFSLVQNNFGPAGTSPGGGYNELFLKLNGSHIFSGVIRNNSGDVTPESNGGEGKGGVSLKIEGNDRTQSLTGLNIYTGSTTISSGKLLIAGAGQLGNNAYPGVLEIANAAETDSQATFEHNGTATLNFTGNIANTGEGAVKGIFLQSGTGKSIITGTKTFTGNVNITNGFLGGGGRMENVNSVNLDGTGSVGGHNDTFTIKGLTFKSESAKLLVTTKPDNSVSLLDVQSLPTSTGVNTLTVDIFASATLQHGYLIRYPDQVQTPAGLPEPVVGANNTGKSVRLQWNNLGLWMQVGNGEITLSLQSGLVCPKGTNPGNPRIVANVTYSDELDLPAEDALLDQYFTLSDDRAKTGDIEVTRNGSVITAQFDGANPTDANLPYTIIYDDSKNRIIRETTRINRKPELSISSGAASSCLGAPIVLQGVSKNGGGTIFSQNTEIATVGSNTAGLTATVTTHATGNVDFLLVDPDGCKSEFLHVTVLISSPSITAESAAICAAANGGGNTTLLSVNQDPAAAPALAWRIIPPATGAAIEDVTVGDRAARFSVTNPTITEPQEFTIEYTNQAGCKGTTVITVNPSPVITPASALICAALNGVGRNVDLEASMDPAAASAWTVNHAADASMEDVTTTDRLAVFRITNTTLTAPKEFTVEFTNQAGCKGTSAITVNPTPVVSASAGSVFDLAKLCTGATYADALTVNETIAGNWAIYKTGTTHIASTISSGVTASATPGRGSIQAGNAHASTVEDVVFISAATCRSSAFPITVHPKPVMNPIGERVYCHDTDIPAFAPTSSGALPEARPTHYQWHAVAGTAANQDDINLTDYVTDWTKTAISSFRPPSIMSTQKRDMSIKGYNSTTGCESESQVFTITIKQGLELEYNSTTPICSGTNTHIFFESSLSDTQYTWTVSDNSLGAVSQNVPTSSAYIEQTLTNTGNSAVSVAYSVRAVTAGASYNCTATVEIPVMVSPTPAVTPSASGGGDYCVSPEGANTYKTNLIPIAPDASTEWTYTSYFPPEQRGGVITGNTQKWGKGPLTAVADDLVLSGQEPAMVSYIFRPFIDCLGAPSSPVLVKIHPAPPAPGIVANSAVCSSSTLHATNTAITLDNPVGLAYTWTVSKTNSPDVSGYTEPSRAGVVVPTANPTAATQGPIEDPLVLAATAASAQTIVYNITPWRNGCPGRVASAHVLVNPLPAVNPPGNRQYCPNDEVTAETLTGTHGANAFKWSGGLTAGLADQVVYGAGLPAYTAPAGYISPVTVTLSAKNENGCESASAATFTLAVVARPTLTLGTSLALCAGPALESAGVTKIGVTTVPAGAQYKWNAEATGTGAEGMKLVKDEVLLSFPYIETTLQEGLFAQKVTAVAGSEASITFNVQPFLGTCAGDVVSTTVQVRGTNLAAGITNNSLAVCNGGTANIKVGDQADGNLYSWAVADNTGSVNGYSQQTEGTTASVISDVLSLSNTRRGNVTYTITASRNDCDGAVVSHTVFVNPIPVITVSPNATICSGSKTAISLSNNLSEPESYNVGYSWTVSTTANSLEGAQARSNPAPAGTVEQTLVNKGEVDGSVTYTFTPHYTPEDGKGTCPGGTAATIYIVKPPVTANIEGDPAPKKVCIGDQAVTLRVSAPQGATYQWLKDNADIPDATDVSYNVPTNIGLSATYSVRVTTSLGCSVPDSRRVEITSDAYFVDGKAEMLIEAIVATGPTTVPANKPVTFKYTGPVAEYSWDFKDNTAVVTTQNATYSYPNSGTFLPTLTVVKASQTACTKIFALPELTVTPMSGDLNSSMALSVFPVPAQDQITIVSEGDELKSITIRDISGKTVANEAVNGHKVTLRVNHLAGGIYLLTVTGTKGVKHLKISKR